MDSYLFDDHNEFSEPRTNLWTTASSQPIEKRRAIYDPASHSVARITRILGLVNDIPYVQSISFDHTKAVFRFGEGSTYRVDRTVLRGPKSRVVAVKRVKDSIESNTLVLTELLLLSHSALREHPNIATPEAYGWGITYGVPHFYLVEEFATLGTIAALLKASSNVTFQEKLCLCQDVIEGLAALHACRIAHGDIKIENTLVFAKDVQKTSGSRFVVRISDFGHAIVKDEGRYLGTPLLLAPEVRGTAESWPKCLSQFYQCDIYSFGLLVWEVLLNGKRYYQAQHCMKDPLARIESDIPDELLRQALFTLHAVATESGLGRYHLFRSAAEKVLLGSIRHQPGDRLQAGEIADILRIAMGERSRTGLNLRPLDLLDATYDDIPGPRALRLIRDWPTEVSEMVMIHLLNVSTEQDKSRAGSAAYALAMCHEYGFGSNSSVDKMLENFELAALLGHPQAALIYSRIYESHRRQANISPAMGQLSYESELQLEHLQPSDRYFSLRLRMFEQNFQRAVLENYFDLYSGTELLESRLSFQSPETLRNCITQSFTTIEVNSLRVISTVCEVGQFEVFSAPLLHCAARLGLRDLIELLVSKGVDVNTIDDRHHVALLHGCKGGHLDALRALIEYGAYCVTGRYESPMSFLFMLPEYDQALALNALEDAGFSVNDSRGGSFHSRECFEIFPYLAFSSPLARAIATGDVHLCKLLLHAGARCSTTENDFALDLALSHHDTTLIELFLRHRNKSRRRGFPLQHLLTLSSTTRRVLHGSFAGRALRSTLKLLLNAGYSINDPDTDGNSPLFWVVRSFSTVDTLNYDALAAMIDEGAKFQTTECSNAWDTVHLLSGTPWSDRGKILRILLQKKIVSTVFEDESLIHAAARLNQTGILTCLIKYRDGEGALLGTDINFHKLSTKRLDYTTLLSSAVLSLADAATVKFLLEHGADPTLQVNAGAGPRMNPLQIAMLHPGVNAEIIDLLLDHGVDLYFSNKDDRIDIFTFSATCETKLEMHGTHPLSHILRRIDGADGRKPRHQRVDELYNELSLSGFGQGSQILAELDVDGRFLPLDLALRACNIDALEALFAHGAMVPKDDVRYGLTTGILLVPRDADDHAALYSTRKALSRMMRLLLERAGWGSSWPPLHVAAIVGHTDRVIELLKAGEELLGLNSENLTAQQVAAQCLKELNGLEASGKVKQNIADLTEANNDLVETINFLRAEEHDFYFRKIKTLVQEAQKAYDYPEQLQVREKEVNAMIAENGLDHPTTMDGVVTLAESYTHLEQWKDATRWLSLAVTACNFDEVNPISSRVSMGLLKCACRLSKPVSDMSFAEYCLRLARTSSLTVKCEIALTNANIERLKGHTNNAMDMLSDLAHLVLADQLELSLLKCPTSSKADGFIEDSYIFSDSASWFDHQYWQELIKLNQALNHCQAQQWSECHSICDDFLTRQPIQPDKQVDYNYSSELTLMKAVDRKIKADAETVERVQVIRDICVQNEAHNQWEQSLRLRNYCYAELNRIYGDYNIVTQDSLNHLAVAARKNAACGEAIKHQSKLLDLLRYRYKGNTRCTEVLKHQIVLAEDLAGAGRLNEAHMLFSITLNTMSEDLGSQHTTILEVKEKYLDAMVHPDMVGTARELALSLSKEWTHIWQTDDSVVDKVIHCMSRVIDVEIICGELLTETETIRTWLNVIEHVKEANGSETLFSKLMLVLALIRDGSFDEAQPICQVVIEGYRSVSGANCTATVIATSCLRLVFLHQDRDEEADNVMVGVHQLDQINDRFTNFRMRWLLVLVTQALADQKAHNYVKQILDPISNQLAGFELDETGVALLNLRIVYGGALFESDGMEEEAKEIFESILQSNCEQLHDRHPIIRRSIYWLARCEQFLDHLDDAEALVERALETFNIDELDGYSTSDCLDILRIADLAVEFFEDHHSWQRVLECQRVVYKVRKILWGELSEVCIEDLVILIKWEKKLASFTQAISLQKTLVRIRERLTGEQDLSTLEALQDLIQLSLDANDLLAAEFALQKFLNIKRDIQGDNFNEYRMHQSQLAKVYMQLRQWSKAQALLEIVLQQQRTILAESNSEITKIKVMLSETLFRQSLYQASEDLVKEILSVEIGALVKIPAGFRDGLSENDSNFWPRLDAQTLLCRICIRQDRLKEAQNLIDEVLRQLKVNFWNEDHKAIEILKLQMIIYRRTDRLDLANETEEEIAIRENVEHELRMQYNEENLRIYRQLRRSERRLETTTDTEIPPDKG